MLELAILKVLNGVECEVWKKDKINTSTLHGIFQVNHTAFKNKIPSPLIYIFRIKSILIFYLPNSLLFSVSYIVSHNYNLR